MITYKDIVHIIHTVDSGRVNWTNGGSSLAGVTKPEPTAYSGSGSSRKGLLRLHNTAWGYPFLYYGFGKSLMSLVYYSLQLCELSALIMDSLAAGLWSRMIS